jgi:intein/homing endonuclease
MKNYWLILSDPTNEVSSQALVYMNKPDHGAIKGLAIHVREVLEPGENREIVLEAMVNSLSKRALSTSTQVLMLKAAKWADENPDPNMIRFNGPVTDLIYENVELKSDIVDLVRSIDHAIESNSEAINGITRGFVTAAEIDIRRSQEMLKRIREYVAEKFKKRKETLP